MPSYGRHLPPRILFGALASMIGAALYVTLYSITTWNPYAVWVVTWSAITLASYAYDKFQAIRGGLRVPKSVLHALAIVGGFLGGWAGMLFFRHKVSRPTFWLVLILSTLGHSVLVCYWFIM